MPFSRIESVTYDVVKTELEEISEDDLDIDLNLTHSIGMDWKLNPNVECKVTLEKLNILPTHNEIHNLGDTEMNVRSSQSSDTYSKFRLPVDKLSNFVGKCEAKCVHCEEYIFLLQNHVIQTHIRSRTANWSHERDNPSCLSNNSNHRKGVYKHRPSSLNIIPNNENVEKEERRMSEIPLENQDFESVGSLIKSELVTLEHVNHFSTIADNLKQEPEDLYQDVPLLELETEPLNLNTHLQDFSGNVVTSETEMTDTHSKNSVGNTVRTFIAPRATKPKPFKCSTCENCFTTNGSLARHNLKHTAESRFKCDLCGKCYNTSVNLITHQWTHTGVKPFQCSICGKRFASSGYLIKHNEMHRGYSRFKCDVCEQGFASSSPLIIHQRTHTGEKPFDCDVCGRGFGAKKTLTRHKFLHTGKKPFKCDLCGIACAINFNLKKHKKLRNH